MVKALMGYLYCENTVVMDKSDIKNSKDEDFRPVRIFIDEKYIKEWAEELNFMKEVEKEESDQLELKW